MDEILSNRITMQKNKNYLFSFIKDTDSLDVTLYNLTNDIENGFEVNFPILSNSAIVLKQAANRDQNIELEKKLRNKKWYR